MTLTRFNVGAFVLGAPTSARVLVQHSNALTAYADGHQLEKDATGEAYLSHFAFGAEMESHYKNNHKSVAGFAGPCWCRWLILDIDRADLNAALDDTRRLAVLLCQRYPESVGELPIYFSGSKGFHALVELAHDPAPSVGFHRIARTLAEALASAAKVQIDTGIYDVNHIVRLPNTKHPKTGLFKRRIDVDDLFRLDIERIRELARHPAGDGIPSLQSVPAQLEIDWHEAEAATARRSETRAATRAAFGTADTRAPRYFLEFLRFSCPEGERHQTLFRCAAWLTEQGAPPSLSFALLTEPGRDTGLMPKDVDRQIRCGIDHAVTQRRNAEAADTRPDPLTDPDAFEQWAMRHEADPLPPGAMNFPSDPLAPEESEGGQP